MTSLRKIKNNIVENIRNKDFYIALALSSFFIILDQITKMLAFNYVDKIIEKTNGVHRSIEILPFFNIAKVWNRGVAFGALGNMNNPHIILSILVFLISLYFLYMMLLSKSKYQLIYYSMIFGGAVGNLIDRVRFGAVADFLDFHILNLHWPAFNLADSFVCVAVAMILVEDLILKKAKK